MMKVFGLILMLLAAATCENLYQNSKYAVGTVTTKNFESQVTNKRNKGQVIIAHFYKSTDGKSHNYREEFNEEAKKSKGIFTFIGIDCDSDFSLCNQEDVREFPAVRVYPPVPIPIQDPDTTLDTKKALRVAAGFVQSRIIEITDDNFQQKLGENPAVPKVLLFTDKPTTPILFKALSLAFDKKLMLGIVRKENQDVFHKHAISSTPKILVLKAGEKKPIEYKGEINYTDIFDFLNIYSEQFVVGGGSSLDGAGDKPWLTEAIPELNSKSANDICYNANGALCVIVFSDAKPSKTALETVKEVRRKYDNKIDRGLNFNFMWIDANKQGGWKSTFGVEEIPSVVILNAGRRKRFIKISGDLEYDRLSKLLPNHRCRAREDQRWRCSF